MMSLAELSEPVRYLIALWSLLLCVFGIIVVVYDVFQRRYAVVFPGVILFLGSYLLWQVILAFNKNQKTGKIGEYISSWAFRSWVVALSLITLILTLMFIQNVRYGKKFITPNTIKICADQLSSGICCFRDNGHVIFSNRCMDQLCVALTNRPLLNGSYFRESLPDEFVTINGRTWRFVCRDLMLEGEPVYEMIASDVTEEYLKTETLRKDTEEISRLNQELQEHRLKMAETIRKQEILQAKVSIHDEMNRLMLGTVVTEPDDQETLKSIFSQWKRNALLLCMEAEADKMAIDKCEKLADQMGIRLVWKNSIPVSMTEMQRELFFSALGEAIINAAKHAEASELTVSFTETVQELAGIFENNGRISGNTKFTGGLVNLSLLAEEQNADITAEADRIFRLRLTFRKNTSE